MVLARDCADTWRTTECPTPFHEPYRVSRRLPALGDRAHEPPQLRGAPGTRRRDPPREPGHGGGGRSPRPACRGAGDGGLTRSAMRARGGRSERSIADPVLYPQVRHTAKFAHFHVPGHDHKDRRYVHAPRSAGRSAPWPGDRIEVGPDPPMVGFDAAGQVQDVQGFEDCDHPLRQTRRWPLRQPVVNFTGDDDARAYRCPADLRNLRSRRASRISRQCRKDVRVERLARVVAKERMGEISPIRVAAPGRRPPCLRP